jgi:hypothetical protein
MTNVVTIAWPRDTPEIAVSYGARLAQDHYDTAADVVCQMDVFIEVPRSLSIDIRVGRLHAPALPASGWRSGTETTSLCRLGYAKHR